jgi:hypothetical protein
MRQMQAQSIYKINGGLIGKGSSISVFMSMEIAGRPMPLVLLIFVNAGLRIISLSINMSRGMLGSYSVGSMVGFFVLYRLWCGAAWTRMGCLILLPLNVLLNLFALSAVYSGSIHVASVDVLMGWLSIIWSTAFVVYLLTPQAKMYFDD